MMRLAWHQFRKDLRVFGPLLIIFVVLMTGDLAAMHGWIPGGEWTWPYHRGVVESMLPRWLALFTLMAVSGIVAGVVYGDTPSRDNAFLRTRPMPAASLWTAKAFFLLVAVVLPLTLAEWVNLRLHGLDTALVAAGTWERFTFVLPTVFIVGSVLATMTGKGMLMGFLGIAYCGFFGGMAVIALLARGDNTWIEIGEPDATAIQVALFVWLAAGSAVAGWILSRRPGYQPRAIAWVVVVLSGIVAGAFGPRNPEPVGSAPADVIRTLSAAKVVMPLGSVSGSVWDHGLGRSRVVWNLHPRLEGMPAGWFVRWGRARAELRTGEGERFTSGPQRRQEGIFNRARASRTDGEQSGLAAVLPEDILLDTQTHATGSEGIGHRPFELPTDGEWREQPVELTLQARGRVYRWRESARLELRPGAAARDGIERWRLAAVTNLPGSTHFDMVVELEKPVLRRTGDPDLLPNDHRVLGRYEFILYDPQTGVGCDLPNRWLNSDRVGGHCAYHRQTLFLRLHGDRLSQAGWSERPETLRLLIYHLDYLGEFEKPISATFTPAALGAPIRERHRRNPEPLSPEAYQRRFTELTPPGPDASRVVVGNHVHALLQLMEAGPRRSEADPVSRALMELAGKHPDVLLDGHAVAIGESQRALRDALVRGLRRDQLPVVLGRLAEDPELAEVLVARDWLEESRDVLFGLLDQPHPLPHHALQALAWFDDARVVERLFAELDTAAADHVYPLLAGRPGLKDRLDGRVWSIWRREPRQFVSNRGLSPGIAVAVRHGIVESVAHLIRQLRLLDSERGIVDFEILRLLGEYVELPGISGSARYDMDKVRAAVLGMGPQPVLVFNPALRRYQAIRGITQPR